MILVCQVIRHDRRGTFLWTLRPTINILLFEYSRRSSCLFLSTAVKPVMNRLRKYRASPSRRSPARPVGSRPSVSCRFLPPPPTPPRAGAVAAAAHPVVRAFAEGYNLRTRDVSTTSKRPPHYVGAFLIKSAPKKSNRVNLPSLHPGVPATPCR